MRNSLARVVVCAAALAIAPTTLVAAGGALAPSVAGAASACPQGQPSGTPAGQQGSGSSAGRPSTYPIGQCQLLLSTGTIPAGGTVTLTGGGLQPNSTVTITMGSRIIGTTTTDSNGAFSSNEVIPASTDPGTYTMTASDGTSAQSATLNVTGAGGSPSGSPAAAPIAFGGGGTSTGSGGASTGSGGASTGSGSGTPSPSGGSSAGSSTPGAAPAHSHAVPPSMITSHGTSNIGLIVAGVIAVLILAAAAILAVWMRRRSVSQR